jgi:hypothetical protein
MARRVAPNGERITSPRHNERDRCEQQDEVVAPRKILRFMTPSQKLNEAVH